MNVIIQAVPWEARRAANARRLAAQTGGTIVWDEGRDPYGTFLRVLAEFGDRAGWLLEDDVVLCRDWAERAAEVVEQHHGLVIRGFSLGTRSGLVRGIEFYSTACVFLPAGTARAILDFEETLTPAVRRREHLDQLHDHLIGMWLAHTRQDYWLHTPSLVQHHRWPSLVDPRGRGLDRVSPTFSG